VGVSVEEAIVKKLMEIGLCAITGDRFSIYTRRI
jgi:hypothetical protein